MANLGEWPCIGTIDLPTPDELPAIQPYLRAKYSQLPPEAVRDIEAHFETVAREHGIRFDPADGPLNGEDE